MVSLHVAQIMFQITFLQQKKVQELLQTTPKIQINKFKNTHLNQLQFHQSIIDNPHIYYSFCLLTQQIYLSPFTPQPHITNPIPPSYLKKQSNQNNDKTTAQKSYCRRFDLQSSLVDSLLPDHFKQIENIFVFVLDIPLFEVHLPFIQQIVHVLMPKIPLQKPSKDALQSQLLLISTRQQLLQVSQTDHYFLQNWLYEFHELLVGNPFLFATFPQNFFIISGKHFADTAFDHINCDIFLIIILKILLLSCSVSTQRLICFWNLLLFLSIVVPCQCDLKRFLDKDLSFFNILEKVGTLVDNESWQEICFICIHWLINELIKKQSLIISPLQAMLFQKTEKEIYRELDLQQR